MADFFKNPQDLMGWIKSRPSSDKASKDLVDVINTFNQSTQGNSDSNSVSESCKQIYEGQDEKQTSDAATILFGVLAKHNITSLSKTSNKEMKTVTASTSPESRQRNDWTRGSRNKWNRVVDGFNEGTPWREDRDKMYNFTHYYTDAITFDADPTHVYSGEALWRTYIMDKYSREYQDKDGHYVGGYINDRFYVFPTAGTPSNPDVPRDGGNQMGLKPGERSRKPRPHQWSTERRLDEARKIKTEDIVATASSFNKITKIASTNADGRESDKIYNIFTDSIDMLEAGVDYEKRLMLMSEHYGVSITKVAQIEKTARTLIEKHSGIGYTMVKKAASTYVVPEDVNVVSLKDNSIKNLKAGTSVVLVDEEKGIYEVASGQNPGEKFTIENKTPVTDTVSVQNASATMPQKTKSQFTSLDNKDGKIQEAAEEVGLNEDFNVNEVQ